MFLVNIDHIPGTGFEVLGLVRGAVVLARDAGTDFLAGLMSIAGGEVVGYTKLLEEARTIATERMEAEAEALGADAVVNVRYTTSEVMNGAAEVLVYGTAVRYK
ncbi:MAG: YbjQ family protein [Oscillospiraceae bacterium]|nr:YbjQ family protein [Oscillospiraceae bacterium]